MELPQILSYFAQTSHQPSCNFIQTKHSSRQWIVANSLINHLLVAPAALPSTTISSIWEDVPLNRASCGGKLPTAIGSSPVFASAQALQHRRRKANCQCSDSFAHFR